MSAEVEFFHDRVSHYVLDGVPIRVVEVDVRDTALEAAQRHAADEIATAAIGQALIAAALLGGHIKGEEKISFQAVGHGNLGSILADCTANGALRAMVQYPDAVAPGRTLSDRLIAALGNGHVFVIKSTSTRELYRGTAPFSHTDLAGAFEIYLEVSEQVASVCWFTVDVIEGQLDRAQGVLLQALGGGDRAEFEAFRSALDHAVVAASLRAGERVIDLLERLFPKSNPREIATRPLRYECTCSEERVLAMLLALGEAELQDMIEKDGQAEVTCEFCRARYQVGADGLSQLLLLSRTASQDLSS